MPPPVLDAAASPERHGFREMVGQPGDFREVPPPRLGAWAKLFRAPSDGSSEVEREKRGASGVELGMATRERSRV